MSKTLITAALLAASVAHAGDFKAAYVDIQRAVMEVEEGKAAKGRLQKMADEKQRAFEAEQAAIKAEVDAFQKQRGMMDDKARDAKEMELQKKTFDFAQRAEKLRAEIAGSERQELASIFPKLEELLGQIAQREGLTMVFDRSSSGLAWAPPSLDLTNELIRMYNAKYKPGSKPAGGGEGGKPAPAGGPKK